MKGCIVCISRPRDMVWIIDLEVVPAGVYGVTVTTGQERYTEIGNFGVADTLHQWHTGVRDITFVLDVGGVFEVYVPFWLEHGSSFVSI